MSIEEEVQSLQKQLQTIEAKLEQLQERLRNDSSTEIGKSINGVTRPKQDSQASRVEATVKRKSHLGSEKEKTMKKSDSDPKEKGKMNTTSGGPLRYATLLAQKAAFSGKNGQKPLKTAVAQRSGPFFAAHTRSVSGVRPTVDTTSSRNVKPIASITKTNQKSSRSVTTSRNQDRRTLRSRSFKVMRHLINMVDQSLVETPVTTQLKDSDRQGKNIGAVDLPRTLMRTNKPTVSKQSEIKPERTETVTTASDEHIKLYRYRSITKYTKIYRSKVKNEGSEQLAEKNDISVEDIIQLYIPKVPPTDKKERYYYSGYATKKMGYCSAPDLSIVPHKIRKKLRDPSFAWYKDRWMLISRPEP
ncbi:hypothetical protein PGT21_019908 [Puccinia graminis f. sp. tritici]|uniref:Uncharacterized protein n=1 Tax=Puccinia graminis f. sp. tritici TaxID=56615 RepID=A0A5B0MIQ3_PUCGR|nr:hypothetical protein PGT21_019908 [Puccinia graminis f. sp. tritici]KAA1126977.1 hypothetical protein PGTUg99_034459 [Puccinia graminis f. sp. tritici]